MTELKESQAKWIVVLVIAIAGLYVVWNSDIGSFNIDLGDVNLNNLANGGGSGAGTGGTTTTTTQTTTTQTMTTTTTTSNSRAPTAMTALVSPNPVNMGGWVVGTVTGNGYNYPIEILATHRGTGATQSIAGFLDGGGMIELDQQINTPGEWEFIVNGGGVSSNTAFLTVQGVVIESEDSFYSRLMDDSQQFMVYSDHKGSCLVYASKDGWATEVTIGTIVINSGGYGSFTISLDWVTLGNYEFDARIAGETARGWGATCWVNIGR